MKKLNLANYNLLFSLLIIILIHNSCKTAKITSTEETKGNISRISGNEINNNDLLISNTSEQNRIMVVGSGNIVNALKFSNGKIISLKDENPYNNLLLKKSGENNFGNNIYTAENKHITEIYQNFDSTLYLFDTKDIKINKVESFTKVLCQVNCAITANIIQAGYFFQTSLTVYNIKGELISIIKDINSNILDVSVSDNTKYLIMQYGYYDSEIDEYIIQQGISVYNLINGKRILNIKDENTSFFIKQNLIIVSKKIFTPIKGKNIVVYDFDKNVSYSRFFTKEEESKIMDITNIGYIMKSSDKDTLEYSKDFKIEVL